MYKKYLCTAPVFAGAGGVPKCTTRRRCWTSGGSPGQTSVQSGVTLRSSVLIFTSQSFNHNVITYWFILFSLCSGLGVKNRSVICDVCPFSFLLLLSILWQGNVRLMSQMELRQTGFDVSDLCISHLCRLMQNLGYWSQQGNPDLTGVWASVSGSFVLHFLTAWIFDRRLSMM